MPDYKEMYIALFRTMTLCIEMMQNAQKTAEEMYISADEAAIQLVSSGKDQENHYGDRD